MEKDDLERQALLYHASPIPGKLAVQLTKPTETQYDLSLAYSPGVAYPVLAIADNPTTVYQYTMKGNLIAVITNGTAILGLGDLGALAAKPVMEGKAVLFKRFANIDVFDIEVDTKDIDSFVETVVNISPTFGGINLEDIKAPECFEIERRLIEKLSIPVFHDDQHGTAVVVAAGLTNALKIQKKSLSSSRIVCVGAGAAGIATMNLLLAMGALKDNIILVDSLGVVHQGRQDLNVYKQPFATQLPIRTLSEAMKDADVFIGVATADLLTEAHIKSMAKNAIIFALSNPSPEVNPELANRVRSDLIIATGRSDYPNQVNNVLCFPYIFKGALSVKAKRINQAMQLAAVNAIAALAHEDVPESVKVNYPGVQEWVFGKHYILPKPIDPRLCAHVSTAVADAALLSFACED